MKWIFHMTILTKPFGYFKVKKILDILVKSTMIRFTFLDAHEIKRKGTKRMKSRAEDSSVPWNTYLETSVLPECWRNDRGLAPSLALALVAIEGTLRNTSLAQQLYPLALFIVQGHSLRSAWRTEKKQEKQHSPSLRQHGWHSFSAFVFTEKCYLNLNWQECT